MQLFCNKWTARMNEIFNLLRSTMIGEHSPDTEGTGEIKYPVQTKTSTAASRLIGGSVKARGRKPRKHITWSSKVTGYVKGQLPIHGKRF